MRIGKMDQKDGYPPAGPPQPQTGQFPGQPSYGPYPGNQQPGYPPPPPYDYNNGANNVYTQPGMPPAGYYQAGGIPIPPGTQVIYVNEMGQPISNQRDRDTLADDCCLWATLGMLCCCCMNAIN